MKRFISRAASVFAAGAAVVAAMLPAASTARADEPVPCPHVIGLCTYSQPQGHGELRIYLQDEPLADPAFRTAQNQTPEPWCVFEHPYFGGPGVQIDAWQTLRDLPFAAASLRERPCQGS